MNATADAAVKGWGDAKRMNILPGNFRKRIGNGGDCWCWDPLEIEEYMRATSLMLFNLYGSSSILDLDKWQSKALHVQ